MLTRKVFMRAICDACARSKLTKYTDRTMVHQSVVKQRVQRLNVTDIEDPEPSEVEVVNDDDDDAIEEDNGPLQNSETPASLTLPVGRLRDLKTCPTLYLSCSQI